jgi:hypothetical protein
MAAVAGRPCHGALLPPSPDHHQHHRLSLPLLPTPPPHQRDDMAGLLSWYRALRSHVFAAATAADAPSGESAGGWEGDDNPLAAVERRLATLHHIAFAELARLLRSQDTPVASPIAKAAGSLPAAAATGGGSPAAPHSGAAASAMTAAGGVSGGSAGGVSPAAAVARVWADYATLAQVRQHPGGGGGGCALARANTAPAVAIRGDCAPQPLTSHSQRHRRADAAVRDAPAAAVLGAGAAARGAAARGGAGRCADG